MSKYLPVTTRKVLFNAIALPHLDYLSVVWTNCNKEPKLKLERLHNYGMRIVLQVPPRTPNSMSRAKLQWTTLEHRRAIQQLRVVHRCVHGFAPEYLEALFTRQPRVVCTHGQLKLSLNVRRSEVFGRYFQHSGARHWSILPDHIKITRNCSKFSRLVKDFIKF